MKRNRKSGRNVDGILLLDKPPGYSSNQALQQVKRLFNARKAGHAGSLDPLATGLLLVCFGYATKVTNYLLEAEKEYLTTCRLGIKTDTADAEGQVIEERPLAELTRERVEAVLAGFRGEIEQVPPMYSALKHKGKRLYELARSGIEVERQPRKLTIHRLELVEMRADELVLDIRCSKGTYVRTLVEDIGEELGCGAHVAALRRLGVGPYVNPDLWNMESLEERAEQGVAALEECLLPIDTALADWPALELNHDLTYYARSGHPVMVPGAPSSGPVRLYDDQRAFIGMGRILDDGRVAPKQLISNR